MKTVISWNDIYKEWETYASHLGLTSPLNMEDFEAGGLRILEREVCSQLTYYVLTNSMLKRQLLCGLHHFVGI